MTKSAYHVFMTNYRAIIKSMLEKIRALNNAFVLSDEELKQLDTPTPITEYDDISDLIFID